VTLSAVGKTWRQVMNLIALQAGEGWSWLAWRMATPARPQEVWLQFIRTSGFPSGPPPRRPAPVMIPFREAMKGYRATVNWLPTQGVAEAQVRGHLVRVQAGSTSVRLDGRQADMAAPADLRDGRLWVPKDLLFMIRIFEPAWQ
jgi:hypothetical protein